MEKTAFVKTKTKSSFIDRIKFSITGKKPKCKGIVEQAEQIVEEYILNCRLQGITLYKKKKKFNFKKAAAALAAAAFIAGIAYLFFV